MDIENRMPQEECYNCSECVLKVKTEGSTTTVDCRKAEQCKQNQQNQQKKKPRGTDPLKVAGNNKPPCKGCEDRYVGCHAKCERFEEYRKIRDKSYEERMVEVRSRPTIPKAMVRDIYRKMKQR